MPRKSNRKTRPSNGPNVKLNAGSRFDMVERSYTQQMDIVLSNVVDSGYSGLSPTVLVSLNDLVQPDSVNIGNFFDQYRITNLAFRCNGVSHTGYDPAKNIRLMDPGSAARVLHLLNLDATVASSASELYNTRGLQSLSAKKCTEKSQFMTAFKPVPEISASEIATEVKEWIPLNQQNIAHRGICVAVQDPENRLSAGDVVTVQLLVTATVQFRGLQ